jgi:hypothetical protein
VGTIYYGGGAMPIHIEDRALAHLKVVIATKLRRNESFTVSWRHADDQPGGRSMIWLHPSIPLRFVFEDPAPADLDQQWIQQLATSASSTGGIMLTAEQIEPGSAPALDSTQDVSLGSVEVDALDVGRLTVAGRKISDGITAAG